MKAFYDADIDYLEVMEEGRETYGVQISDALLIFLTEGSREIAGFGLEAARDHLSELESVPNRMRLAGLIRLARGMKDLTQRALSNETHIGERTLQRAEAGDANLTFENLMSLVTTTPDLDFSVLLKPLKMHKKIKAG
jgi:uncharacterized protein YuzE